MKRPEMRLVINVTRKGAGIKDSEIGNFLMTFSFWLQGLEGVYTNFSPYDLAGELHTKPLTKLSQDEELGGYFNCNEWQLNVDSELTALCARAYYAEGIIPKDCLEIQVEGEKLDMDDEGFFKPGPDGQRPEVNVYMNFIRRLTAKPAAVYARQ